MRKLIVLSAMLMSCYGSLGYAQTQLLCPNIKDDDFLPPGADVENGKIDVTADKAQLIKQGTSVFTGDVKVLRDGQEMQADRATYNRDSGDITAKGHITVRDSDMIVHAEQGEWSQHKDSGTMLDAEYRLRQMHARGNASRVDRQGQTITDLDNATYTTCAEGDNAWLLKAGHLHLDHVTAVGTGEDVTLRLGGVPIFYTPYISFPLNDQRKSGFLIPTIGSSDKTGFDLSTPYYWNIAPNKDATLTPRYMSSRGLMLDGQYRYLYDSGEGTIDAGFLGSDNLKKQGGELNPNYNEDRKHFTWKHNSSFNSGFYANLDYNYVSDKQYLEDFGSNLSLTSTSYLNRLLDVGYTADNWNLDARLQGYQTLIDVTDPYQRLPQVKFHGTLPDQAMGLSYGLDAAYVDFAHSTLVDGQRISVEPSISLPMGNSSYYLTPRVALNQTQYSLGNDPTSIYNDSASRTLPVASIDSGVYFERDMHFGESSYIQTLEPRAFYLYVPYRDQSDIPVFDSALTTFNMTRLFAYNRFTGDDRYGDANQLSLALTSRIIDPQTGIEKLRMTVGQIQYFADRRVTLPNQTPETRRQSDIVTEVVASIAKEWSVSGEMQLSPSGLISDMSSLQLRYRGDNGTVFNIGHRYRRDGANNLPGLEQVDVSGKLPINDKWSVVGRWYRSIKDGRTLEGLAGVQYDSCCWATRVVVRNYVNSATSNTRNTAIFFQIELKGLGNLGKTSDKLLQRSILGYEAE